MNVRSSIAALVLACATAAPVAAQFEVAASPEQLEHERSVWTSRADRVHRAFASAGPARRAAALEILGGPRPPDALALARAWHVLEGRPAAELDHPLQRLVDGLDLQVRPGALGNLAERRNHVVGVYPVVAAPVSGDVTTTLTWRRGELARHARQEPIGAAHFSRPGFTMFVADPRRAGDPEGAWELVPSLLSEGRRFVGVPVTVPVLEEDAPPGDPALRAAFLRWTEAGLRSYGSFEASCDARAGVPVELAPGIVAWRRPAVGEPRGTVLLTTWGAESVAGPLTGWTGTRWDVATEAGWELVALAPGARANAAFGEVVRSLRSRGPVVLVLRGDALASWLLGRPSEPAAFDAVVLVNAVIRPSSALAGEAPVLWIGTGASRATSPAVRGIEGTGSSFLDEGALAEQFVAWSAELGLTAASADGTGATR